MITSRDSIQEKLRDGVSPSAILNEFEGGDERAAAFEIVCATPRFDITPGTRRQHLLLTTLVAVLAFADLLLSADALMSGDSPVQPLVGLVGNCFVLVGLRHRYLSTYVGLQLWLLLIALADLRSSASQPSEDDPLALGITLSVLGTMALLARSLRRRLFPYSCWRGIPRTPSGEVIIPDDLRSIHRAA